MAEQTPVNSQILATVEEANHLLEEAGRNATIAIAYQEVAQSMAIAVQSGVEHLQSTFTLHTATVGRAFSGVFEGEPPKLLDEILGTSNRTVETAIANLGRIADEAAKVLKEFPRPAPAPPRDGGGTASKTEEVAKKVASAAAAEPPSSKKPPSAAKKSSGKKG